MDNLLWRRFEFNIDNRLSKILFLPGTNEDRNFPDLSSASTAIHHVSVKLFRLSEKEFRLFIPRGFALSIWEILLETASQFGYEIIDS